MVYLNYKGNYNMKKIVIAGSAKLQKEINNWIQIFESNNYEVLN